MRACVRETRTRARAYMRMRFSARSISRECDLREIGGSRDSKLLLLASIH